MSQGVHRSSISATSGSHYDELSDTELIKLVGELKQNLKALQLENDVLERVLTRLDPSLLQGIQQAIEYASKFQSYSSMNVGSFVKSQTSKFGFESLASPSRMLTSPSKVSTRRIDSSARVGGTVIFGTGPRVNVLERSELVSTEMEIVIRNLEKVRSKAAKQHALLKAQLEEIGLRVNDIVKSYELFDKQVIVEGWDSIAQRIPAEIWIRFMTEWVKATDSQIGKLRLRTSTLNTHYSKLKGQIQVKEELSQNLRPVDFDKLKIENGECISVIEQKIQQLGELKKMTGDANLNLAVHKKALMQQNTYLANVLRTIRTKQQQAAVLDREKNVIEDEADKLEDKLEGVRKLRSAFEVPDVMDYVRVKAEVADLKHSIKMLENRSRVQQFALKSLTRQLKILN
ncbi:coiled-coil domain-containing protein 113 [Bombyx mori]|uniref:Cilia- and flagella-associated protein 263 n=1 Tax=Bombyx mori TaxID=7091 RepID=A0A8R1WGA7_BOMMO|nr:coiled-coil domain-containing protein 113 [Bombyx mori]